MVFLLVFLVYGKATDLPWRAYHTFVLEEKHGFNKQVNLLVTEPIKPESSRVGACVVDKR